jgi:hypothetical protein
MLQRRSLEESARHRQRWLTGQPTPQAGRPLFLVIQPPVMRASHHQCAKVPLVPEVMERAWLTIRKEHRSVMPTHPTTGILTLKKVTIRCQIMVPLSSSNDDLSLVKHDARVDLNPACTRIHYTQEPAFVPDSPLPSRYTQEPTFMSNSPLPSLLPYIVLG